MCVCISVCYKNHPEWKWQKTEFWYSLNDEELDELCTQHRFDRGHEGLASVEVREKPVSAKSATRTALTGFRQTSTLAKAEWPRFETMLSRKRVQILHCWANIEMSFSSFSRGMFRLYRHVWTWYKSESDKYKTIVFNTFLALNRITMVSTMETIVSWVSFQKGLTILRFCIIFTNFEPCFRWYLCVLRQFAWSSKTANVVKKTWLTLCVFKRSTTDGWSWVQVT